MEMKTLKKRLESIIQMRADSTTLLRSTDTSLNNGENSNRESPRKSSSPTHLKHTVPKLPTILF